MALNRSTVCLHIGWVDYAGYHSYVMKCYFQSTDGVTEYYALYDGFSDHCPWTWMWHTETNFIYLLKRTKYMSAHQIRRDNSSTFSKIVTQLAVIRLTSLHLFVVEIVFRAYTVQRKIWHYVPFWFKDNSIITSYCTCIYSCDLKK